MTIPSIVKNAYGAGWGWIIEIKLSVSKFVSFQPLSPSSTMKGERDTQSNGVYQMPHNVSALCWVQNKPQALVCKGKSAFLLTKAYYWKKG